jgi:hypothetical protein
MIMEDWKNNAWKKTIRFTNTIDSNGNIITSTGDTLNTATDVWGKSIITTNTLNSNPANTINFSITQIWDAGENKWIDSQKKVYTYDGSKNILTIKTQIFMDPDFMDWALTTNTYNGSGQLIKEVDQQLDFFSGQMKNANQTTYTYNPDGTENQTIYQTWNILTGLWDYSSRMTNAYNGSKKISSTLTENFTSGVWTNSNKSSETYNADGSVKEVLNQNWNATGSNWLDNGKEAFSYFANGSINQILTTEWLAAQSIWGNQSRITFTYNSTSIIEPKVFGADQLLVFPNPFTDVISIEFNSSKVSGFELYNSNGQLVRVFEKGQPLSNINLSYLKDGIYLIKAVSPESKQVIKLLKLSN